MDHKTEVKEFLRTRRARITPEQTGLIGGGRRRVTGLRREEVAMLAGVSTDYYARLERGDLGGVSDEVLDSLARALRLDEAEVSHLHDLARAAAPAPLRRAPRPADTAIRPSLQALLDAITGAPAWVTNRRGDFLALNPLAAALFSPLLTDPANERNNARFTFFSPAARTFYRDWEHGADMVAANLRTAAGRNPHDKVLTGLIGELVTRSDAFRARWATHDVRLHRNGVKRIHHPEVGDLEFSYEGLELPASPGWVLYAYTAAAGSPTEERLRLLGSLAATPLQDAADRVEPRA